MNKYIFIIIIFLNGCNLGMTNDEIILETKKCKDAGLRAAVLENIHGEIIIQCRPEINKRKKQ